jgi:hypothetical protein
MPYIAPSSAAGASSSNQVTRFTPDLSQPCSICLDPLDNPAKIMPCNHVFDLECLKAYFSCVGSNVRAKCCPLCRGRAEVVEVVGGINDWLSVSDWKLVGRRGDDLETAERNISRVNQDGNDVAVDPEGNPELFADMSFELASHYHPPVMPTFRVSYHQEPQPHLRTDLQYNNRYRQAPLLDISNRHSNQHQHPRRIPYSVNRYSWRSPP